MNTLDGDKSLEPGKIYSRSIVLLREEVEASHVDVIYLIVQKAFDDLLGPNAQRVKFPVAADVLRFTITARVEPWKLGETR